MNAKLGYALAVLAACAVASCSLFEKGPGTAVVQFYNNSGRTVLVENNELRPGRTGTFKYPRDSGHALIVFWNGCVHTYIAPDSQPGEFRETDWLLRGAFRTQLNPDGKLYLLPSGVSAPADPAGLQQPAGFPLEPREGSSCLQ